MANEFHVDGDGFFTGELGANTMNIPDDTVTNAMVASGAAIVTTKMKHQYAKNTQQESDTSSTDQTFVNHVAYGAGSVVSFKVGAIVAPVGAATVDIDLLKNGVTVLNAAAQLTSGETARELVAGVIGTAAYVAGDVFEVDIDQTTGGGTDAKGVFAEAIYREAAS
jgi:hypothetical protein